jgi:hypothetical protein
MYVLYIDILKLMMLIDTVMLVYYFAPVCPKSCARIVTNKQDFFFANVALIKQGYKTCIIVLQMLAVSESLLWIIFFSLGPEDKHSNPSLSQSVPLIFQFP